jgi:hypothetical protein
MVADARAIAVDVPHRSRKIDLVITAMEHRDVVAAPRQFAHDARADEDRSADDEDATHGPILFHLKPYGARLSLVVDVAIIGIVVVLLVVVAITLVGRSLPIGHVASRAATFRRTPEEVWAAINDPALLSSRGVGDMKFETVESLPPKLLVRRVVGENDFGGTWTCDIASSPDGSTLTITENGEIYNAFFRFVSRFIIGHHRTIDGTMAALRKRFGEA